MNPINLTFQQYHAHIFNEFFGISPNTTKHFQEIAFFFLLNKLHENIQNRPQHKAFMLLLL